MQYIYSDAIIILIVSLLYFLGKNCPQFYLSLSIVGVCLGVKITVERKKKL